jgi:hypothetical protein
VSAGESRRDAALALAQRGFSVLPIARDTKQPDSLLTARGWMDATQDADTIAGWFDVRPSCNVGLACGPKFNIVVVDIDCKNGAPGLETARRLFPSEPLTLTAGTPSGGIHHYFRHPGVALAAKLPGIDIKGACGCGYVVAPPSVLVTGSYRWRDETVAIAPFPEHMIAVCTPGNSRPASDGPLSMPASDSEGGRHNQLVRLAVLYRDRGLELDEVRALLWHRAESHFCPPFSRTSPADCEEIDRIVDWLPRRTWGEP